MRPIQVAVPGDHACQAQGQILQSQRGKAVPSTDFGGYPTLVSASTKQSANTIKYPHQR